MLGYVTAEGRGAGDRLLFALAERLHGAGFSLAGAVQENRDRADAMPCDMDLHILTGGEVVRISQHLGRGARGCRLDPAGLEQAVGMVLAALDAPVDAVIVNKFGKQESEVGRGFRPVFAEALMRELPVVTAVTPGQREAFLEFAGEMAIELPAEIDALFDWVCAQTGRDRAA